MPWRADSVQAAAYFSTGTPQVDALAMWHVLFPHEGPRSFEKPSGALNAVSKAIGTQGGIHLSIATQIGRIDLLSQARPGPEVGEPLNLQQTVSATAQQLRQLLGHISVFKIEMIANLSAGAEQGFGKTLSAIAKGIYFHDDATDCIYQLNVPLASNQKVDLQINRMCTWSSGERSLISFNVGLDGSPIGPEPPMTIKTTPIVNLKIDVSAAIDSGAAFSRDDELVIWEIASQVLAIAQDGAEALN